MAWKAMIPIRGIRGLRRPGADRTPVEAGRTGGGGVRVLTIPAVDAGPCPGVGSSSGMEAREGT